MQRAAAADTARAAAAEYWRRWPAPGPSPSPRVRRGGIYREDCGPACTEVGGVGEEVNLQRYAPRAPPPCLHAHSKRTCERCGRSGCSAQLPCAGGHRQGKEEAANQSQTCVGSHDSVIEGVRMRLPRHQRSCRQAGGRPEVPRPGSCSSSPAPNGAGVRPEVMEDGGQGSGRPGAPLRLRRRSPATHPATARAAGSAAAK